MSAMMYHFKQIINDYPARFMIELIMFLNKRITNAEFRYWFIELEIADLMKILKKTKHMIDFAQQFFIIYTDYETAIEISRQKSFFTSFTNKLNFRLIKISEYIQRFNFIIRHKSEKKHVVSNVFFRFKTEESNADPEFKKNKLNALSIIMQKSIFNFFSVVEIFQKFRNFIMKNYQTESTWIKIKNTIVKTVRNEIRISFYDENNLIYFDEKRIINRISHRQLCLFQIALKKTFRFVHDESHLDFHKCYELLFFVYYIRGLTANFKIYLKHCSECQTNQIQKHKFHETLQPIQSPSTSFHTIVMNFILIFFSIKKRLNCAMSVTCKFFKKIILISEKIIWKTKNWVKTFLIHFDIMN